MPSARTIVERQMQARKRASSAAKQKAVDKRRIQKEQARARLRKQINSRKGANVTTTTRTTPLPLTKLPKLDLKKYKLLKNYPKKSMNYFKKVKKMSIDWPPRMVEKFNKSISEPLPKYPKYDGELRRKLAEKMDLPNHIPVKSMSERQLEDGIFRLVKRSTTLTPIERLRLEDLRNELARRELARRELARRPRTLDKFGRKKLL